jgi:hypothetical protein
MNSSKKSESFLKASLEDPLSKTKQDGKKSGAVPGIQIDPAEEHKYWRAHFKSRPYVMDNAEFNDYAPAYQYGWESYSLFSDQAFELIEPQIALDWNKHKGLSRLKWQDARKATRDAWERIAKRHQSSSR